MIKELRRSVISPIAERRLRSARKWIRRTWYWGGRYHCNFCDGSFRRFLPFGMVERPNARCPACGSLERHRLLWFYLTRERILERKPLKLLHFAPEPWLSASIRRKEGVTYIDADLHPARARHAVDITGMPFVDESFDVIICAHVLGHVRDEHAGVQEMVRVLRPDGVAIVMTVLDPGSAVTVEDAQITTEAERVARYGEPDLHRLHGRDFPERLERGGFHVAVIDYRQILGPQIVERYRLGNGVRELIFRCEKSGR